MSTKPASFSESAQHLSSILERFRQENLPLEDALALFEEGVQHVQTCQKLLTNSKAKIEVLSVSLEEAPKPLDDEQAPRASSLHQVKTPLSQPVKEEDLRTLFLSLKKEYGLKNLTAPELYEKNDGTGHYLHVPLETGFLILSVDLINDELLVLSDTPNLAKLSEVELSSAIF